MAVGARDGAIDLWLNENHPGDHRTVTDAFRGRVGQSNLLRTVPMVSIDSFVESNQISKRVGFIKIDVQGYETEVCQGMQQTLQDNPRATVAVEYGPGSMAELGIAPSTLIDFFVERGFHLYELRRNGRLEMLTGGLVDVGADGWTNLVCSREQL
jgi:hypothetical protein